MSTWGQINLIAVKLPQRQLRAFQEPGWATPTHRRPWVSTIHAARGSGGERSCTLSRGDVSCPAGQEVLC
jgi:hypothetical protein